MLSARALACLSDRHYNYLSIIKDSRARRSLHMLPRDSQLLHNNQSSSSGSLPSDSHSQVPALPQSHSISSESASVSDAPTPVERSQSWQIAPDLFSSFKYAWAGINYAFKTQRNFRIHAGVGTIAILLCWTLKVTTIETAIICLTIGAVLVMEILNTALESLVDLTVGQTYHELAKVAKDCAAGAVLMAAIVALLIALLIFAPPLWTILLAA